MQNNVIIQDSEAFSQDNPKFEMPARHERENLTAGDYAQLVFRVNPPTSKLEGERMWLIVTSRNANGRYTGQLCNQPMLVDMSLGELVDFGPEHIIKIVKGGA